MHYFSMLLSFALPLFSLIASVQAWDCTLLFQQELENQGLIKLAALLTTINQTAIGEGLLAQIAQGNFTFFAPTDEAIGNVSSEVSGNTTLFAEYLSYHFVHGNFKNESSSCNQSSPTSTSTTSSSSSSSTAGSATLLGRLFRRQSSSSSPPLDSGIYPNTTLGRTLLNASELVSLPGNNSQVLAWTTSSENGNVTILNQAQNITVINTTQWNTIFIARVNGVFIPPGNITTALNATNATITANLLQSIQLPSSNGTNETATEFLQDAVGITFFVPNNLAFLSVVNQTISALQNNVTALSAVLENHYINGTVFYSPVIQALGQNSSSPNATTAAGEPLQFVTNSSGTYVVGSSGISAKIVRPDVLIDNGVIHIIDTVLLDNSSDPSAASSAYESATSAAASLTTENGPIGVSTTTSEMSASSTSSTSSSSESSSSESSSSGSSTSTESSTSESSGQPSTTTVTIPAPSSSATTASA